MDAEEQARTDEPGLQRRARRWPRVLKRAAIVSGGGAILVIAAALAGALWVRAQLRGSLPALEGELTLPGLRSAVVVERDSLGVPTLTGQSRVDLARATGFLHAQDRFFQMDLLRRRAAGELAELVGPAAVSVDRANRLHGFRRAARGVVESAEPAERELIEAYVDGVNAGLAALDRPPFEYLVLRAQPAPWRAEDTPLVIYSMFLELQDGSGSRDAALGLMGDLLPEAMVEFLAPRGTEWDAPLVGEPFTAPPVPGPDVFSVDRAARPREPAETRTRASKPAVSGSTGRAQTTHPGELAATAGLAGNGEATEMEEVTASATSRVASARAAEGLVHLNGGRRQSLQVGPNLPISNDWAAAGSYTAGRRALLSGERRRTSRGEPCVAGSNNREVAGSCAAAWQVLPYGERGPKSQDEPKVAGSNNREVAGSCAAAWQVLLSGERRPTSQDEPKVAGSNDREVAGSCAAAWQVLLSGERRPTSQDEPKVAGSNNWAVAGSHTADGRALLASDMHLPLGVPNIWYRASLVWPEAGTAVDESKGGGVPPEKSESRHGRPDGGASSRSGSVRQHRVTGVMLPGTPAVVAGSNGGVAWGFTNTMGDWSDLVVLEEDPERPDEYRTPDGWQAFEKRAETIRVRGAADEPLEILETIWGPVIDADHAGRRRALRWIAHGPEAVNLRLLRLERARDRHDVLALAPSCGMPAQNVVTADADGGIAWTIMGSIPRRVGHDGRLPSSWADGARRWDGKLSAEEYPRIVDPPEGRLWTANARTVDGEWLRRLGDGGYAMGARGRQIRDALRGLERATEADMLALQLDDRALFLERWQRLMLDAFAEERGLEEPLRAELRALVEGWGGRASTDSVGYRMVRAFRLAVAKLAFEPLLAGCRQADPRFGLGVIAQYEGPLWRLVTEQPLHVLDPRFASWPQLFQAATEEVVAAALQGGGPLRDRTWGEQNTARVQHPLSRAVPALGRWLDMPRTPLAGDNHMPRVQTPSFGASTRMVVSPGHEGEGIFHMPCGQSGHPLSPHYRDGHEAWARGVATAFLPGPAVHRLVLEPGAGSLR